MNPAPRNSRGPHRRVAIGLLGLALAGCQGEEPPSDQADKATHFRATLDGRPVHLALEDCEVFYVPPKGRRERVLSTDFYPMFSVCQRQEASLGDGYILVQLGRQALGAGGCCATGGTWRSRDGRVWERRQADGWEKVEPSAPPANP